LKATLGKPVVYAKSSGDLGPAAAWADDDNVYVAADDATGFDTAPSCRLNINKVIGASPPDIKGITINSMSEYTEKPWWPSISHAGVTPDGATWKATGLTGVDGVLYMFVSRQKHEVPRYPVYQQWDSSIIKSHDRGLSWSPQPRLGKPMFPGSTFSTAFFVQYGKDGQGTKNGADQFIYASSSDGCWNNGDWMILGRVRRDRIDRLDPHDWEFIHDFDKQGQPIWHPRHDNALYIFRSPGRTSEAAIHYFEGLDLYILPQWYFVNLEDEDEDRGWHVSRFEFYYAPACRSPKVDLSQNN
jgi:hypothetical protein